MVIYISYQKKKKEWPGEPRFVRTDQKIAEKSRKRSHSSITSDMKMWFIAPERQGQKQRQHRRDKGGFKSNKSYHPTHLLTQLSFHRNVWWMIPQTDKQVDFAKLCRMENGKKGEGNFRGREGTGIKTNERKKGRTNKTQRFGWDGIERWCRWWW